MTNEEQAQFFDFYFDLEKYASSLIMQRDILKDQVDIFKKEIEIIKSELQSILDEETHGEMCERLIQQRSSNCDCYKKRIRNLLNGK